MALILGPAVTASAEVPSGTNDAYCSVSLPQEVWVCADSPATLASMPTAGVHADATQYLIARLFDNADYDTSAGYLNVYASGDCTLSGGNVDYSISDLDTWSDRVSSFESFGNCGTRLWSGISFSGSAYPTASSFLADSSYVGAAFNDKARSAQFS